MNYDMTYEQALSEARERQGEREISDDAARVLCAAWHSPGTVGWVLAAVSTGAWSPKSLRDGSLSRGRHNYEDGGETRGEEFRTDLWLTFRNVARGGTPGAVANEEMIVWSALGTWSMNGGDND